MATFHLNPLLNVDSYKHSHFLQYPAGTEGMFSYIEARKDNSGFGIDRVTFFGLQGWIKDYLMTPITMKDVDQAAKICKIHGEPFAYEEWKRVVNDHGGLPPFVIRAVKEGTQVPIGEVLVTVEALDSKISAVNRLFMSWIESFFETQALRSTWFGTTVATISRHCKEIIFGFLAETSDHPIDEIPFKLHDFGARGASSTETSWIAGAAHLINFMGTDTMSALQWLNERYHADYESLGFSIPAAEHSTITSWSKSGESQAYRNMCDKFGSGLFAVVSDSYNIFNAVKDIWGTELRDLVLSLPGTLVVRPDSGDPVQVVTAIVGILADKFGFTLNSKGYKVLNKVRVIQGDGVNPTSIRAILTALKLAGFSAENVAFGMGGALHQKVDRDTFGFAMKCSAVLIDGTWHDVFKDPIAGGKTSKRGRLALILDENGKPTTIRSESLMGRKDLLEVVYDYGKLVRDQNFSEVRCLGAIG
jgi:nicotinamide phosphoribosyltransferase